MTLLQFAARLTAGDVTAMAAQARVLAEAGARWVQLDLPGADWTERDLADWAGALLDNGLEIGVLGCYMNPLCPEERCPADAATLRRLIPLHPLPGANRIAVWSGARGGVGTGTDVSARSGEDAEAFADFFLDLLPLLEDHDAQLVVHPHPAHVLPSAQACRDLVEHCPQNRLTFVYDPALWMAGGGAGESGGGGTEGVLEELDRLSSHLGLVTLRDCPRTGSGAATFVAPGDGVLNYGAVMGALDGLMYPLLTVLAETPAERWAAVRDAVLSSIPDA